MSMSTATYSLLPVFT